MDIKNEVLKLQKSRLLRNTSEVNDFELAIENITLTKDVKLIRDLCSGFDDQTNEHEVMFGLVHAIEDFEGEEGILEMTQAIPSMLPHAKEWAMILNYRILNHVPSRKLYANVLTKVDKLVKDIIIGILMDVKAEDPARFENAVNEVLSALE